MNTRNALLAMIASLPIWLQATPQPAVDWDGLQATFYSDDDGPWVLGFRFRADVDLLVTSLGAFDYLGDGLATAHQIGIWSVDGGSPLAVVTVSSGNDAPLVGAFRYGEITGLPLSVNSEYIIGASDFYGQELDIYPWNPQAFTTRPGITFLGARESDNQVVGLSFPDREYSPGSPLAANFQFEIIPEPSGILLLGVGLSWVIAVKRRAKKMATPDGSTECRDGVSVDNRPRLLRRW